MRCPWCYSETSVIETRARPNTTTRRIRECANGHRFPTDEAYASSTEMSDYRNKAILAALENGELRAMIARQFQISDSQVTRVCKGRR